jgi:CubicO group peptidase (beta-lactamase class C family)
MTYSIKIRRLCAIGCAMLFAAAVSACGGGGGSPGADLPPPSGYAYTPPGTLADGWQIAHAADSGLSVAGIQNMMDAIDNGEFPIIDSIAIAHRGSLVLDEIFRTELSQADGNVANVDLAMHAQFSISKSFASALVGIAVDQQVIGGPEVPFLSLFPYDALENPDPRKQAVTLHDALTMQLGLEWNEWDPPYSDPDNQLFRFHAEHVDYAKGLLDLPMATDPGSIFAYNTVATTALGQAIENAAPLSLIDYGGANFLLPLEIARVEVIRTPSGLPDLGRGLFLTTRDLLKLGQLYLDEGQWNGQRVVSEDWVRRSRTAYTELRWPEPDTMDWQLDGYGYQWWIGHFDIDGRRLDSYAAWGFGAQWLMVIPELELVIAVNANGRDGAPDETNQPLTLMKRFVIPAALD